MRGHKLSVAQIFLIAAPAFFLFGYNQSGVGGLLSLQDWTKHFPQIDTVHTKGEVKAKNSTLQGFVVATFTIGALFGALSCSRIGDIFGRRKMIFGAATLSLIGEVLQCTSFGLAQFIVGRVILGLGIGVLSATVPVWQSECSPAKNRGKHVVLDGLFISFGYMTAAWVNLGFFQLKPGPIPWRLPLAIPTLVSILLMSTTFFLPESPRWLVRQNRLQEAAYALSALQGLPSDSDSVRHEIDAISYTLESSRDTAKFRDIFTMGHEKLFYRFMLCFFLQFAQQMSGGNLISVYSTIIFQENLGLSSQVSRILSGGTLTWKFLSCFVAFFTVDRFGRRALLMVSGGGMALCMMSLCIATSFPETNKSASVAAVFFIFMFNFFIPIGFLGANFLYCTEVAPIRLRMAMTSVSTANHWLWNLVVTLLTPVAINSIGFRYYIVYTCIGMVIPISVFIFYPETMGRSLEELEDIFRSNESIFKIVSASRHAPIKGAPTVEDDKLDISEELVEVVKGV
ncbi:hypothetical protein V501_06823 [Pseudogymnoascus sp. VKM F-4519 (FW-2642)]|nr:hypothetical protein V501_06823 [Pseudogymnoascus sp. VKM F-4519 (FW-2642)]